MSNANEPTVQLLWTPLFWEQPANRQRGRQEFTIIIIYILNFRIESALISFLLFSQYVVAIIHLKMDSKRLWSWNLYVFKSIYIHTIYIQKGCTYMLVSEGEKIHCFKPLNHRCLFLLYTINVRIVTGLPFLVGIEASTFNKKQYIFLKYYYISILYMSLLDSS